jgi:hypothetical protein
VRSMAGAIGLAIDALAVITLMGPTERRRRVAETEADLHRKEAGANSVNLHQSQSTWTRSRQMEGISLWVQWGRK